MLKDFSRNQFFSFKTLLTFSKNYLRAISNYSNYFLFSLTRYAEQLKNGNFKQSSLGIRVDVLNLTQKMSVV